MRNPETVDVPVRGGELRALRWPGAGPVVVAVHGITANALAWSQVAEHLDGAVTLVAPDLRGRAASAGLPEPYGIRSHAEDLVAVLDHLGESQSVLVGHSMGAFVVAVAAARAPERVREVVLVDGGVAFPAPPGTDVDAVLQAVIGPAMERLGMTFRTREAYRDFWRRHPAIGPAWSPAVDAYVQRDLVGQEPALRSSCVLDAVRTDGWEVLADEPTRRAVHELQCPVTLLWAARGLLDEPQGLYDEQRLASAGLDEAHVCVEQIPAVNHYTILLADVGASRVAAHLHRAARADR